MRTKRVIAAVLAVLAVGLHPAAADDAPPPEQEVVNRTPPRLSFTDGDVSFWRPGAADWGPASVNTPLAPGDALYTGSAANLELQIGPRAFVRAGENTQLSLDNQEPDFIQLKATTGHVSIDVRSLTPGHTIELDTPNAAFTIERTGYYRADLDEDTTTFITRRGGRASMTPAGGEATAIAPSEEVVVEGIDAPTVESYVAPELDVWDRWNYDRTDHMLDALSARYVPSGTYGAETLDHYGTWRVVPAYGPIWVPDGVGSGWVPYSTGRWIWDPYYGWTWVDSAPWGWAPYHYGRWVYVDDFWAWAPGPVVVAPVYAPALVAFYGGGFGVSVGFGVGTVGWVALGWGEPVVPWWGPPHFCGHPYWGGWGGPHVVNNITINKTEIINVNDIHEHRNASVRNAVVAVQRDRFLNGPIEHAQVTRVDPSHLTPVRGALPLKPTAASLTPATGRANRPPESVIRRPVVATRAPHDVAAPLRDAGIKPRTDVAPAPERIVPAPRRPPGTAEMTRPPFSHGNAPERARPALPPRFEGSQPAARPAPVPEARRVPQAQPPPQARRPEPIAPQAPPLREPPAVQQPRPEAAPPAPRAPRELPGEPANQVFQGRAQPHAPHAAPHMQQPMAAPAAPAQGPHTAPSGNGGGRGGPRHP